MHFSVSWDIPVSTPNRADFEIKLIDCFRSLQYVKPLTTFYIIKVASQNEYTNVLTNLQNVGKTINGIKLVATPIMTGGRYDGLHINETWQVINQISG